MPPDRGRASQACTACRKQKTRCYESGNVEGCLRCQRLELQCSLSGSSGGITVQDVNGASASYGERLARLERIVERVVAHLDGTQQPESILLASTTTEEPYAASEFAESAPGPSSAPVFAIRDIATEVGFDQQLPRSGAQFVDAAQDVISKRFLTKDQAIALLKLFNEHYGRWVSFNDTPTEVLLQDLRRKSPLLLCACCLIAVRHTSEDLAEAIAPRLFQEAKTLLSAGLLTVPQSFAFFQASLILSLWSTTIGQVLLSIDSWLSSGFALQHSLASEMFLPIFQKINPSAHLSRESLHHLCVWNHLCLVHLHYSVGTRRRPLVDRAQIEKCRKVLDSDHATNFEYRIVAEVYLYWIIHENCSREVVDLPKTQVELHAWKQEWKFLFNQPRSHFVQMGFHFAQLLVFDQALKSRSAAVRESLLSEMVRLSAAILRLAMDTADDRTRHLTDHIYHVITFAAVTLCRLLHMYEDKLSAAHNLLELDQLVLDLVIWLRSIGLPCHVAHTLGDVVAAFHKKLRPDARPTPSREEMEFWGQPEFSNFFPELLGTDLYDGSSYPLLPDWEPFDSGANVPP